MPKSDKQAKKERAELTRRMLAVEDPVEMKTDPGTEILIATTQEDEPDEDREYVTLERYHRSPTIHIRGVGEVTKY